MKVFGNYTIRGHGVDSFCSVVVNLNNRVWLWSSVCDKFGDWLVSTLDEVPLEQLIAVIESLDIRCDIIAYGELTASLDQVAEFSEVSQREDPIWTNEPKGVPA